MKPPNNPRVYIMRDGSGEPLYVGVSLNFVQRVTNHSAKDWFADVRQVEVVPYTTIHEAREAEAETIRRLKPQHNDMHSCDMPEDGEPCTYWRSCGSQAVAFTLPGNARYVRVNAVCEEHSYSYPYAGHQYAKRTYPTREEAHAEAVRRRDAWLSRRDAKDAA